MNNRIEFNDGHKPTRTNRGAKNAVEERIGNWQQTYTGLMFWPLDPRPEDIVIEDVAHALSMICRFGGHCRDFYSVAQHSVIVSHAIETYEIGKDPRVQLWGLLHDASEAYVGDVIRPIKPYLTNYKQIEFDIMVAVLRRFGLFDVEPSMPSVVKLCDDRACATEARDLMTKAPAMWWESGTMPMPFEKHIEPWAPKFAERIFLQRFYDLNARITALDAGRGGPR